MGVGTGMEMGPRVGVMVGGGGVEPGIGAWGWTGEENSCSRHFKGVRVRVGAGGGGSNGGGGDNGGVTDGPDGSGS